MPKTFVTADLHLGEDRFELMGRPFTYQQEHLHILTFNHNQLVDPDDTVIVNGDVCYQKYPEYLRYIDRFNGNKILIRGNHDRVFTDEQLKPYFSEIIPEGDGIIRTIGNGDSAFDVYITHYPTCGRPDMFNLVGHIHGAWKYQLNMFNVGVDVNNYRPVDMDKISFHRDAIFKYYDDDAWVAYKDINATYLGKRGKAGTYFKK